MTIETRPTERLAIDGGAPLRTEPFGPRWIFGDAERRQLMEVMDNAPTGWRSQFKVREFADRFATIHGAQYAVATTSGTGAIHSAVAAIDPEPGDEIITTPTSDIGSVLGILLQNAVPVFADWDPETFNTDPADVERRITSRTRAILLVHLFGNPCDMDAFLALGRRHNLPIIEDCSQAHLAEYQGRLVGTIGDVGAFSLGGKTLTTDQGGMVITNDEALARRAMGFSRKGAELDTALRSSLAPTSYRRGSPRGYAFLGDFHPMTDLEAAVGLAQLDRWEDATRVRRRTAAILDEVVGALPGFHIQKVRPGDRNSYYVYAYAIDEAVAGVTSDQFADAVRAEGIPDCYGAYIQGKPLYRYPIFAEERTYGRSGYPFVDERGQRRIDYETLHLPVIERLLPQTGFILFRNSYTEQDAVDIGAAMGKVARQYAARR
jgi:dTDP-4-amino-4,6-dideoxygalactose transaminase